MSSIWEIRRSATDTKVAGLCGGVAEHFGVDPVLVRVAWVLLALSGGIGAVLYLAGWLLVPLQGHRTGPLHDVLGESARRWPREVWVALVVVACLVSFSLTAKATFGLGPAIVLAAVWYFGFTKHRRCAPGHTGTARTGDARSAAAVKAPAQPQFLPHPGPATPFTEAAEAWQRRVEQHVQQHVVAPAGAPAPHHAAAPAAPAVDPELAARTAFLAQPDPVGLYDVAPAPEPVAPVRGRDRRSARQLRLVCLLVLGLALAGLSLADRAGVDLPASGYAATALLVVGLALLAATWLGRARGLLPLGLLLVPVVAATLVLPPVSQLHQFSAVQRTYTTPTELPVGGDDHPAGELRVDLSRFAAEGDTSYAARVGTGRLEVLVPPEANVVLRYRVGLGAVRAYGDQVGGGSELSATIPPAAPVAGKPTLTLDLSVDRGELEVVR